MSSRKSVILLLLALAALSALHVAVSGLSRSGRGERRRTLLEDSAAVASVAVERNGRPALTLERGDGGEWRISSPFAGLADGQAVARMLDALAQTPVTDAISEAELLKLGRERADFSLLNAPFRLDCSMPGKTVSIDFGMPTPTADGVYAAVGGMESVLILPAEILHAADRPLDDFRQRRFLPAGADGMSAFTVRRGGEPGLSFRRTAGGWTVDGELASPARTASILSALAGASATGFVWPTGAAGEPQRANAALLAGYGLEPDDAVSVSVKGAAGAEFRFSIGRSAGNGEVYALIHGGRAIATAAESLKALLQQPKSAFTDSRLFPVGADAVDRIRIVDGGDAYVLARTPDAGWRVDSPVSAPAQTAVVERLLARILALPADAAAAEGGGLVDVSLSGDSGSASVPRRQVLGGDRLDDVRSTEMLRIDPAEVRRVAVKGPGARRPAAAVRARGADGWRLEGGGDSAAAGRVGDLLAALDPLVAVRVERLKVSASELDGFGLARPHLTVAVDLDRQDSIRRNLLIGGKTRGGRFATAGSADAVFVVAEETVRRLASALAGE